MYSHTFMPLSTCSHVKQCHGGSVEEKEVLLLHIENQAIVQVVIKELAQHLNLKEESKVNVVSFIGFIQTHWMLFAYM